MCGIEMPFNLITLKFWSSVKFICTYIAQKNKPKIYIYRCILYWKHQIHNYHIVCLKFFKIYLTLWWKDWWPLRASMQSILQIPGSYHSGDDSSSANLLLGSCFPESVGSRVLDPENGRCLAVSHSLFSCCRCQTAGNRAICFLCQPTIWATPVICFAFSPLTLLYTCPTFSGSSFPS